MKLPREIEIKGKALHLVRHNALIIADLHLGYEEMIASRGTLVPRFQFKDTVDSIEKIIEKLTGQIDKIIINGDLKHEFGRISEQEWREIIRFIDYLSGKIKEVIMIKGNHDIMAGQISGKRNIKIVKNHIFDDILVTHGDVIDDDAKNKEIRTIIIGHEHPALFLRENSKLERFKCFLIGRWNGKKLIVQPSFNPLIEGTDILGGRTLSPYITDIDRMGVYVPSKEKVFYFGEVMGLR